MHRTVKRRDRERLFSLEMPPRFTSRNFVFRSKSRYARQKSFLKPCHVRQVDGCKCLDFLVQEVQELLFPQRTAEARELLKQGMRIGGPVSRVPGEPMTSYISRRRRWWTLVQEMDNTLEPR